MARCKCRRQVVEAVAVVPTRKARRVRGNPAPNTCRTRRPTGKLRKADRDALPSCAFADARRRQYPIHDKGHASTAIAYIERDYQSGKLSGREADLFRSRARAAQRRLGVEVHGNPGPSPGQKEKTPMAKKAAKKAAKGKRRGSKSAGKKLAMYNKLVAGGMNKAEAHKKAWGKLPAFAPKHPKRKRTRKSGSAPKRKTTHRRAARRRAAPSATIGVSVPVSVGATRARRASGKRRSTKRARKSGAARKPRKTTRRRTHKRRAGTHVVRFGATTRLTRKNPISSTKQLAVGVLFVAIGYGSAEILDRVLSTRAGASPAGKVTFGANAISMRHVHPDYVRVGAAAGGTVVLGGAAYALRRRSPWATVIFGGSAVGFGLKTIGLGLSWLLPKVLPVADQAEETWTNRLLPEDFAGWEPQPASTTAGAPWNRQITGSVGAADFGPVASGSVGCGCRSCGCASGEPHRPSCGCPKAQTPPTSAPPESAGASVNDGASGTGTYAGYAVVGPQLPGRFRIIKGAAPLASLDQALGMKG